MRLRTILLFLPFAALPVRAADAPVSPADEVRTLACEGPFARDATEDSLKAAFGAANVEYKTVAGAEGMETQATVVFPNDPGRTVTVFWWDEAARAKPAMVQVQADFAGDPDGTNPWKTDILWQSAQGIRIGSTLEQIETLNGKPFDVSGFGWDYGGFAVAWNGGTLETDEGGCNLTVRFAPSADPVPDGALGDTQLKSDGAEMAAAKPRVTEFSIGYPSE
jgi:hypothetical protein